MSVASTTAIRILESDNNRRGDLFGRLMADLFVALGYEQPNLNVHKSGRELDLSADHRLERRRAIAECKATATPIGGDDLNKFVGALDAEQTDKSPITGYFISLAGFKETAIEQEKQRRRTKVVMLPGPQIIEELIRGRMLISKDQATEVAGRICARLDDLTLDPEAEILAHDRGWIWAIYYTQGKARTHFALIHSDGTRLARAVADEVITSDRNCGGELHQLSCLNPWPAPVSDEGQHAAEALRAHRQYLENECGFIHLDGLPADSEAGSLRLRLENLFVPLHLDVTEEDGETKKERQPVGDVLSGHPRLALLAPPGGGKSTLIKRLAIAYSDPARREQIVDDLPARDWFPLFFRCRELRGLARGSFAELIEALSEREPVRQHAAAFKSLVDSALLSGRVLLLVDGLDEISDSGDRAAFVCTLRSALQAYPGVAAVITSREAGYRHVAAHLTSMCTSVTLSPFIEEDIRRLTVAWHREVVGDAEKVRTDAEQLAVTITQNDRIMRLAVNPLLLTTLLLVKRWVGSLPTRRAVLYGKAVEVLLMTWNTEGHEPIPEEEALPQLCYVASAMILNGVQKVSRTQLATWLHEARAALPTELGYVKGTVDEFIHRVEDRSSLMMMTGYDVEAGRLAEFFEFRHLTFQEFLTARAMVEGWHPGRKETDTLVGVLEPHFEKEEWREIIPLAALLGGKSTENLILRLAQVLMKTELGERHSPPPGLIVLGNCLADEAAARPETIRTAVHELVRCGRHIESGTFSRLLARGRYGADFRAEARKMVMEVAEPYDSAWALGEAVWNQTVETEDVIGYNRAAERFLEQLNSTEHVDRIEGTLGSLYLCYELLGHFNELVPPPLTEPLQCIGAALIPVLFSESTIDHLVAAWAYSWLGRCDIWRPPVEPDVLAQLWRIWQRSPDYEARRMAAWALATLPLEPRDGGTRFASVPPEELESSLKFELPEAEGTATLILAWYVRAIPDAELAIRAKILRSDNPHLERILARLLTHLGEDPEQETGIPKKSSRARKRRKHGLGV